VLRALITQPQSDKEISEQVTYMKINDEDKKILEA